MKIFAPEGVLTVYQALALENLLLEDPAGADGVLFCWSGECAVVMGKNQNPWRECQLDFIRASGCKLARRVSGGGTVYHDPGNMNISWILPREVYRAEKMHGILIRALNRLGVPAAMGDGGSLVLNGQKISGSAFCYRKDRVLHHGTLLIDADLAALRTALMPPSLRMQTHAVDSVPASVVNLQALYPELTKTGIQQSLVKEAESHFGPMDLLREMPDCDSEALRLASDEWIWHQTPSFRSEVRLPNGEVLAFQVRKGKMVECSVGSQVLDLAAAPIFPDGDFSELETRLGIERGRMEGLLAKAGWRKL